MAKRRKYLKKAISRVLAIQLDLETPGFTYEKWGGTQTCKAGDWIVNNNGDTYTVDRDSFARTYRAVGPGLYEKSAPVWAEVAEQPGQITTKEGVTQYRAGSYIVSNNEDGTDGYAVDADKFETMYESAD